MISPSWAGRARTLADPAVAIVVDELAVAVNVVAHRPHRIIG